MRKFIFMTLTEFLLLGITSCGTKSKGNTSETMNTYTQISMEQAITMMEEEKDYIILDVRTPEEFYEKHIPNAINVPNENIGTEEISELPDKEQLILVYCRSGNRSKQASENWWHWDTTMCMSLAELILGRARR